MKIIVVMLTKREYKELYLLHYQKAQAGVVESQFKLGEYYEKGNGVVKNYQLAAFWYQKAVDGKHPLASLNLSWLQLKKANGEQNDMQVDLFNRCLSDCRRLEQSCSRLALLSDGCDGFQKSNVFGVLRQL